MRWFYLGLVAWVLGLTALVVGLMNALFGDLQTLTLLPVTLLLWGVTYGCANRIKRG